MVLGMCLVTHGRGDGKRVSCPLAASVALRRSQNASLNRRDRRSCPECQPYVESHTFRVHGLVLTNSASTAKGARVGDRRDH